MARMPTPSLRTRAMLDLYQSKMRTVDIARLFGVTPGTVRRTANAYGVQRHPRLSGDHLDEVCRMSSEGLSLRQIADKLDISHSMVVYRLSKRGLRSSQKRSPYREKVRPLADEGLSSAEIGRRLGISQSMASRLIREYRAEQGTP